MITKPTRFWLLLSAVCRYPAQRRHWTVTKLGVSEGYLQFTTSEQRWNLTLRAQAAKKRIWGSKWSAIMKAYKPEYSYWVFVETARKFLLVVTIQSISDYPLYAGAMVCFVLSFFTAIHFAHAPFANNDLNNFHGQWCFVVVISVLFFSCSLLL
jgi:hypothetical protein